MVLKLFFAIIEFPNLKGKHNSNIISVINYEFIINNIIWKFNNLSHFYFSSNIYARIGFPRVERVLNNERVVHNDNNDKRLLWSDPSPIKLSWISYTIQTSIIASHLLAISTLNSQIHISNKWMRFQMFQFMPFGPLLSL